MKKFKEFLLEVEDWKDQVASNDETVKGLSSKGFKLKDVNYEM